MGLSTRRVGSGGEGPRAPRGKRYQFAATTLSLLRRRRCWIARERRGMDFDPEAAVEPAVKMPRQCGVSVRPAMAGLGLVKALDERGLAGIDLDCDVRAAQHDPLDRHPEPPQVRRQADLA